MTNSILFAALLSKPTGRRTRQALLIAVLTVAGCTTTPPPLNGNNPYPPAEYNAPASSLIGNDARVQAPTPVSTNDNSKQEAQTAPSPVLEHEGNSSPAPPPPPSSAAPETILVTAADEGFYQERDGSLTFYPAGNSRPNDGRAKLNDAQVRNYMDHGTIYPLPSIRPILPSYRQAPSPANYGWHPPAENGSYYGEISDATGRPKTVHVNGYYRSDGSYVRGHYRSKPR